MEAAAAAASSQASRQPSTAAAEEQLRVRQKTLEAVLEQCQLALQMLHDDLNTNPVSDVPTAAAEPAEATEGLEERASESGDPPPPPPPPMDVDYDTDELCDLLKSKFESADFLGRLSSNHKSINHSNAADETASWDMVTAMDLWEDKHWESDQDGYVLVRQEDILDGIACFMAEYLLSLKETKELTPNKLQEALSKTFSVKKKKSKFRMAWDGTRVIYNVASWSATAIGIYQNPAILEAASAAFWASCRVISKFL